MLDVADALPPLLPPAPMRRERAVACNEPDNLLGHANRAVNDQHADIGERHVFGGSEVGHSSPFAAGVHNCACASISAIADWYSRPWMLSPWVLATAALKAASVSQKQPART